MNPFDSIAFRIAAQLARSGVADDGAAKPREDRPVDVGRLAALVFVPAHERDGVACAGVRQRHAGKARSADGCRNARHDFERDAVLVEEERFLSAAIEDERVAPLQPRHDLAFARFLDQEVADGLLVERLRCRASHVDALRGLPRIAQQSRVDQMVVEHDVGGFEIAQSANADECRVARARADEVDDWTHQVSRIR